MPAQIRPNHASRSSNIPVDDEVEAVITVSYLFNPLTGQYEVATPGSTGDNVSVKRASDGTLINPATQETLALVQAATEATRLAVEGSQAMLSLIRGEQVRRTDALAAGTNRIGSVIPVRDDRVIFTRLSSNAVGSSVFGNTSYDVSDVQEMFFGVSVTALFGVSPSINVILERLGSDGVWYPLWETGAISAVGTRQVSIGPGLIVPELATTVRSRFVIQGTNNPSVDFSATLIGK